MAETESKTLTINDPVDPETLQKLEALSNAKQNLAVQLADLELDRLRILGTLRQVHQQFDTLVSEVMSSRGLEGDASIRIDPETGAITFQEAE